MIANQNAEKNLQANENASLLAAFWLVPHQVLNGNERADRLAKAAARRAHMAAARTEEQRQDQTLDAIADAIVATITNK